MSDYPRLLHTAIDATDARGLSEFYRHLLGLTYRPGDEPPPDGDEDEADWLVLVDDQGGRVLAIQEVEELAATTWPVPLIPMQMHLDFGVADRVTLELHRRRAEALGARLLLDRTHDDTEPLYVLADPAGHPFCLLVATED